MMVSLPGQTQNWIVTVFPGYLALGYAIAGAVGIGFIVVVPATVLGVRRGTEPGLLRISSIYRRMGWCGVVWNATLYLVLLQFEFSKPTADSVEILIGTIACGFVVLLFFSMLRTADGLELNFPRSYRRARWTGILAATVYFPWLTIPSYLAVRRLEEYRRNVELEP